MRFVGLRRSEELQMSLKEDEERQFICGTSGMGWPTLREASPVDVGEIRATSISGRHSQGIPLRRTSAEGPLAHDDHPPSVSAKY